MPAYSEKLDDRIDDFLSKNPSLADIKTFIEQEAQRIVGSGVKCS
jgi:hypothetical protein